MRTNLKFWPIALLLCGVAGAGSIMGDEGAVSYVSALNLIKGGETMARRIGISCNIKANISTAGERIYHLPGQRDYDVAVVSKIYGERYFCSEAEAQRNGWRRSKV